MVIGGLERRVISSRMNRNAERDRGQNGSRHILSHLGEKVKNLGDEGEAAFTRREVRVVIFKNDITG